MGDNVYTIYNVKQGDCTWIAAKKILASKGVKNITTEMIVDEMNRLVKINNKQNIDEFNTEYFSKLPSSFYTDIKAQMKSQEKEIQQCRSFSGTNVSLDINESAYTASNNTIYVAPYPNEEKIKIPTADEIEMETINNLSDDKQKIIQYNKKHSKTNYIIIDKENCTACVYSPKGEMLKSVPIGLGKRKGDEMNRGMKNGQWDAQGAFTPAGQFTLKAAKKTPHNLHGYKSDKGNYLNLYSLKGIQHDPAYKEAVTIALHQVPIYRRAERNHLLEDDKKNHNISNNRMSFGCINVLASDFEDMNKFIGAGASLYIMPEDEGNSLVLDKNPKGEKVFKVKYQNPANQAAADRAEMKYYKIDEKTSLAMMMAKFL